MEKININQLFIDIKNLFEEISNKMNLLETAVLTQNKLQGVENTPPATSNDDRIKNIVSNNDKFGKILVIGAIGCGKSSTINALLGEERAKIGDGFDAETQDFSEYSLNNLIFIDSPGLGESIERDEKITKLISEKIKEKDATGKFLIDAIIVIVDGSSRDLGTTYNLIREAVFDNLGENKNRLLIAINQADRAMKGKGWDNVNSLPNEELMEFLEEKVRSTKERIKEGTNIDSNVIYYSVVDSAKPFNLKALTTYINELL